MERQNGNFSHGGMNTRVVRSQLRRQIPVPLDDMIRYVTEHQARSYFPDLQAGMDIQGAEFLPPETLSIAGQQTPCFVLHVPFTSGESAGSDSGITVWIEKERQLIRRLRSVSTVSPSVVTPLRKLHIVETIT
jgi:hypothetical protein